MIERERERECVKTSHPSIPISYSQRKKNPCEFITEKRKGKEKLSRLILKPPNTFPSFPQPNAPTPPSF
jgi:hypothetical protein